MKITDYIVSSELTLAEAIETINARATQILLVTSAGDRLVGTVTDGDIRRALLRQCGPATSIREIMNASPIKAAPDWSPQQAQSLMQVNRIHHIPVVDDRGALKGIFTSESLISNMLLPNTAVLMVGGYGRRLGAMTEQCPKPMLQIGGKPILHTIIETLRDAGLCRFVLAVNYLASQIEEYFGDGGWLGVEISYCPEPEPLGTAGALRLVDVVNDEPLLVMNGDILTRLNFGHLLRYHVDAAAAATMCVRQFSQQIPFGVVELEGHQIVGIQEKPSTSFFVNSGIYVLEPAALQCIPTSGPFDMPQLFEALREQGKTTIAYPVQEYWTDIGQPDDFQEAQNRFAENFRQQ